MKLAEAEVSVGLDRHASFARRIILFALCAWLWPVPGRAQLVACNESAAAIADAVARVHRSIDPCGESNEILEILDKVVRCSRNVYEVCADTEIARNVFDRPLAHGGKTPPRTIAWNPELRTELEPICEGDPAQPLLRDPTASLLHELAHAAQDCDGLNPGEHELEAVRIENVYRRAAGLCERSGYGDNLLPAPMAAACDPRSCSCSTPEGRDRPLQARPASVLAQSHEATSSANKTTGISQTSGDRPAR